MHKIFGDKCEVAYVDRKGAYIIPSHDGKLGVVQTPKGFFFLGGGIDENETWYSVKKKYKLNGECETFSVN